MIAHLQNEEKKLNRLKDSNREDTKRGIFGTILTSVFSVNGEISRDIDELNQNQQDLIQASNHQAKFIMKALAQFNDTEDRINKKLEHFQSSISKGKGEIKKMQSWYRNIDKNKLSIYLLSIYQIAKDYFEEIIKQYKNSMNAHVNPQSVYEFIPPAHIDRSRSIQKTSEYKNPTASNHKDRIDAH